MSYAIQFEADCAQLLENWFSLHHTPLQANSLWLCVDIVYSVNQPVFSVLFLSL